MTFHRLPKDAKRRRNSRPWDECQKAMNKLYYGDENINDGPGKESMFRGVVVMGVVLAQPEPGGELVASAGGTWVFDPREPRYALVLAERLRLLADELEREAAS